MNFYADGKEYPVIHTAEYQLTHVEDLKKEEKSRTDARLKAAFIDAINDLWKLGESGYINLWESAWFSDLESTLADLKRLGYHIYYVEDYNSDTKRLDRKYTIYLKAQDDVGISEWEEDPEPRNCGDCQHYYYFVGEAGCELNDTSYPELCENFTLDKE